MRCVILVGLMLGLLAPPAFGQRLSERIENMKRRQARAVDADAQRMAILRNRLRDIVQDVNIQDATAREAFAWFSRTTEVPVVIDWAALELDGIDPDQRITLSLRSIPAGRLLGVLMQQLSATAITPESELIFELTPWYVQVMTKGQANRKPVTRVYDVADLVVEIPTFDDAPSFDLNDALSNTNSGGSNQSSNIFDDDDRDSREERKTKQQRGEELAQLVRDTIEPTIWQANGGTVGSIKYLNGRLIVRAPLYVQRQIGIPAIAPGARTPRQLAPDVRNVRPNTRPNGVSGVTDEPGSVSGVGR